MKKKSIQQEHRDHDINETRGERDLISCPNTRKAIWESYPSNCTFLFVSRFSDWLRNALVDTRIRNHSDHPNPPLPPIRTAEENNPNAAYFYAQFCTMRVSEWSFWRVESLLCYRVTSHGKSGLLSGNFVSAHLVPEIYAGNWTFHPNLSVKTININDAKSTLRYIILIHYCFIM